MGALSLTGCRNEAGINNNGEVKSQTLTISAPATKAVAVDTRTVMEGDKTTGFNTAWTMASDKLGVYAYHPEVYGLSATVNSEFSITSVEEGVATFEGRIYTDNVDRTYDVYAYYPRISANNNSPYTSVPASIRSTQIMPANGTYDPANDYMVALPGKQVVVTGGEAITADIADFQFKYIVGFMNLTIENITADGIAATDVVKSVQITAEGANGNPVIAGDFNLDLTNGNMTFTSESNTLTVNCAVGTTLGDLDMWAIVNPFTLTGADKLTFLITTETHTIEKSITATQMGGSFAIAAGTVKTFGMTIDNACTITALVVDDGIVFKETFDDCLGANYPASGNTYGGSSVTMPTSYKTAGWSYTTCSAQKGCVCVTGKDITLPALANLTEPTNVVFSFNAYSFEGKGKRPMLYVTATNTSLGTGAKDIDNVQLLEGVNSGTTIPAGTGIESQIYTFNIPGARSTTKIRIYGLSSEDARFFLDDVIVKKAQ